METPTSTLSTKLTLIKEQNDTDSSFIRVETPKHENKPFNDAPPMTLEWSHLHLQVSIENPQTKRSERKTILNDVSGFAKPGELFVIMGPSGAGKSTLLDCISGRNQSVEGDITVNGMP